MFYQQGAKEKRSKNFSVYTVTVMLIMTL